MSANYSDVVETARAYYNSGDADNFYFEIWGGEDIHIGLYKTDDEAIPVASQRTVQTMAARLGVLDKNSRIVDLGAGYGGAARLLARTFGCHVSCVNLSEAQNERNRALTQEAGLADLIDVRDDSFENIPYEAASFDVAWSQDSILHSGNRQRVLEEVDRVLKPGGQMIFTDPMQADDCPDGVLGSVLQRIHLDTLGSFQFYRSEAKRLGWVEVGIDNLTHQLVNHYTRVRQELAGRHNELSALVSEDYIDRMIQGLTHWIDAGDSAYLAWGILHFRKPV
jgi:sarcosine/dimethylglycine N-methyltransferase